MGEHQLDSSTCEGTQEENGTKDILKINTTNNDTKDCKEDIITKEDIQDNLQEVDMPFDHFYVLVHGNNGSPEHVKIIHEKLIETHSKQGLRILSLLSECNTGSTWQGVKRGGKALATEIVDFLNIRKIDYKIPMTIISHSLGGLYARTAIGILFSDPVQEYIPQIIPAGFITVNTPHLGSLKPSLTWQASLKRTIGNAYLSIIKQTGKDLALRDVVLQKVAKYAIKNAQKKNKKKKKLAPNTNPDSPQVLSKEVSDKLKQLEDENTRLKEFIRQSHGTSFEEIELLSISSPNSSEISSVNTPSSTTCTSSSTTTSDSMTVTEKLPDEIEKQILKETDESPEETKKTDEEEEPFLFKLSRFEGKYVQALLKFQSRTLIACPYYDFVVPFASASIRSVNPYPFPSFRNLSSVSVYGYSGFQNQDFEDFFKNMGCDEDDIDFVNAVPCSRDLKRYGCFYVEKNDDNPQDMDNNAETLFYKKMMTDLQKVPWRRLDVQFEFVSKLSVITGCGHGICMGIPGKIPSILPETDIALGPHFCSFLARLCVVDHRLVKDCIKK